MHGNQWVLKIAVLKYYSVSKRGTTAKSNPKQATDPISLHTKFGDNSSNTFPLNERKPCVTPDIGRRTPDAGHRTSDGEKSKNNISTPQGGGHNNPKAFHKCLPHSKPCFIYPSSWLADFTITLTTVGKPQGVFCLLYIFTFMANFLFYLLNVQDIIPVCVLLWQIGYKEISLANINYT